MPQELEHRGQKIIVFGPDKVCYYLFEDLDPDGDIEEYEVKSVEEAKAAIDRRLDRNI